MNGVIGDIARAFAVGWLAALATGLGLFAASEVHLGDVRYRWSPRRLFPKPRTRMAPYRCPTCGAARASLLDTCDRPTCLRLDLDVDTAIRRAS